MELKGRDASGAASPEILALWAEVKHLTQTTEDHSMSEVPKPRPTQGAARAATETATKADRPSTPSEEGRVVEVPLGALRANPRNARRTRISTARFQSLVESMRQDGQKVPALGFRDAERNVVLIEGHNRWRAALELGFATLQVQLEAKPKDEFELYRQSRMLNTERAAMGPLDDALAWRMLLADGVLPSQTVLARRMGISEGLVSKTLTLAELPQEALDVLGEFQEPATLTWLYELCGYWKATGPGADQTLQLLAQHAKRPLSSRDIAARREALGQVKKRRAATQTKVVEGTWARGVLQIAGTGQLILKVDGPQDATWMLDFAAELESFVRNALGEKDSPD